MKTYQQLSTLLKAREICLARKNQEWSERHEDSILQIVKDSAPSGSGFDNGTKMDLDASTSEKLVFTIAFHHMDENGYYDGWTEHKIIITASLQYDYDIEITGKDRNDIKEYMYNVFSDFLDKEIV